MPRHTSSETSILRKLQHEACVLRDQGMCVRCGSTSNLAASHVYPKGKHRSMEYDLDNVKTLCYSCHIQWWHKHPLDAAEWFNAKYSVRAKRLKLMSQTSGKIIDYKLLRIYLLSEIKRYAKSYTT